MDMAASIPAIRQVLKSLEKYECLSILCALSILLSKTSPMLCIAMRLLFPFG